MRENIWQGTTFLLFFFPFFGAGRGGRKQKGGLGAFSSPQTPKSSRWPDMHSERSVGGFVMLVASWFYCQFCNGNFSFLAICRLSFHSAASSFHCQFCNENLLVFLPFFLGKGRGGVRTILTTPKSAPDSVSVSCQQNANWYRYLKNELLICKLTG